MACLGVLGVVSRWRRDEHGEPLPHSKDLLEERFKPPVQEGQPLADKILVLLLIAVFVGLIVFIPLDVFRFHLMGKPGAVISSLGLVLFVAGWWIMTLALRENAFAAPVVKHQERKTTKE